MDCRPYFQLRKMLPHDTSGVSYTPPQLRTDYNFPPDLDGTGETIACVELGGGHSQPNFDSYFGSFSYNPLPKPFKTVSVRGAASDPTIGNPATPEVMLDGCVTIGTAPGAQGMFVYAPNDDNGIGDAITAAVQAGATIVVICWGTAEANWSVAGMNHTTAALVAAQAAGVTVIIACGDNGSTDGLAGKNVDFPASSAHGLGVGGTSMTQASAQGRTEVVWNNGGNGGATGGGISAKFTIPTWQAKANVPGGTMRGVPDIAAVADPQTGYLVIVDSQQMVIGGTSGAAPLWGGALACVNQGLLRAGGKRLGFVNPFIYSLIDGPPVFKDITTGNNGTYMARPLYDCCTGYGTPYVDKFLAAAMLAQGLGGPPPPPPPPPPPGGTVTLTQPIKVTATITVPVGDYPTA